MSLAFPHHSRHQVLWSTHGFEASKGERNLKTWAKHVCKTARKCGELVFIEQTARRVSDHLLLEKALDVVSQSSVKDKESGVKETTGVSPQTWKFTRKLPHVVYHMETDLAYMNGTVPVDFPELINEPIKEVLRRTHPQDTIINIWKEIRIDFPTSVGGYHHVRAYHQFDVHGAFFDWVQIKSESRRRKADGSEEVTETYRPALVLLLYQTCEEKTNHAVVWMAKSASKDQLDLETNISARWSMKTQTSTGLPLIQLVPISHIDQCISVHRLWNEYNTSHFPQEQHRYSIEVDYSMDDWLLNFIDDGQWRDPSVAG